ncbi:MAG: hypothetical protein HRU76_10580 [Phycisphaeraceae bacterium]|nr:hypothetical protein [Phycisphaerales bacterium]QOJ18005.1 MAG: hypothetical protein HRU76_10580 [Phycisphaeraceae bacterium]
MTRSLLRSGLFACLAACALGLSACSSGDKATNETASMGVINSHCPMMAEHEVDTAVTPAEYKGHKIGFCCSGCLNGWNKMTTEQKDAFVSKSLSKANMGAVGGASSKSGCSGGSCSESAGSCSGESKSQASPGAVGGSCCSSGK